MRAGFLMGLILCLSACQLMSPRMDDWVGYTQAFDRLDSPRARAEVREQALMRYQTEPDDTARLQLAYVLSRPNAPLRRLERSRAILAEIPSTSPYAPWRDMLDAELRALGDLRRAQGYAVELEAQLEALKQIETDLQRNRRERENRPR